MRVVLFFIIVTMCISVNQSVFANVIITEENRTFLSVQHVDPNFQLKLQTFYTWHVNDQQTQEEMQHARDRNTELTTRVEQAIREVDRIVISKVETQYNNVRTKHDKLLTAYKKLTQQYAAVKLLNKSPIKKTIQTELDIIRPAVYLARSEINRSLKQLQQVRKVRTTRMAQLRKQLQTTQYTKTKILSSRSALSPTNQLLQAEWRSLSKQKDRSQGTATLNKCLQLSTELTNRKASILQLEKKLETELISLLRSASRS